MSAAVAQSPGQTVKRRSGEENRSKGKELPCEIRPRIADDDTYEDFESARATIVRLGSIERARRICSENGAPSRSMTTMAALSYVPLV